MCRRCGGSWADRQRLNFCCMHSPCPTRIRNNLEIGPIDQLTCLPLHAHRQAGGATAGCWLEEELRSIEVRKRGGTQDERRRALCALWQLGTASCVYGMRMDAGTFHVRWIGALLGGVRSQSRPVLSPGSTKS